MLKSDICFYYCHLVSDKRQQYIRNDTNQHHHIAAISYKQLQHGTTPRKNLKVLIQFQLKELRIVHHAIWERGNW